MGKIYKNPPLIEAICEIRFTPDPHWDMTIFGKFYEKIADQFPERQQQVQLQAQFPPNSMESAISEVEPRMRFTRSDKSALVQLAPQRLIVNQLAPYISWEAFRSSILNVLTTYRSIAESSIVERIGLRYINRFAFPRQDFSIGKWFAPTPYLPGAMLDVGTPYFVRLEFPFATDRRIILTTGTLDEQKSDTNTQAILLDIDCVTLSPSESEQTVEQLLEDGHMAVEQIFESFLTTELRILLGATGEST
jgi:uncharacterized protein (TIGR04255 family)